MPLAAGQGGERPGENMKSGTRPTQVSQGELSMHQSAFDHMKRVFDKFVESARHQVVVDIGSRTVSGQVLNHKSIIEEHGLSYIGLDVVEGPNVDVVMRKPYRLPLKSRSADIILCGQVFEHVPYFWITFLEMARVLRSGGIILLSAPSRGHRHSPPTDCWRFYPDGMLALGVFARLDVLYAHTDFPPKVPDGKRLDYSRVSAYRYWGDTVGVFRKGSNYPEFRIAAIREPLVFWANRLPPVKPGVAPQRN
jgi:SAM-dependent methyltransferase